MTDPDSGAVRDFDCLMLYLCSMDPMLGCRCTESNCRVSNSGDPTQARFDLTLSDDGSRLIGSQNFDFLADPPFPGDVTFMRQAD